MFKRKRAQAGLAVVSAIVAIIVGVAMLPIFTSLIDDAQSIKTVTNESLTNTDFNETVALANSDIVLSSTIVLNFSGNSTSSVQDTLREGLEYGVTENSGKIQFVNRTGKWAVTYQYKPTTYVDTATGRTVVKQITLMYGVFLLLLVVATIGISLRNA